MTDFFTVVERQRACREFSDVPVRLIVIDTLRKATPGKSENDARDMSVFLQNCDALATAFRCHVNFVHHAPRSDKTRGSGTNAVDGACHVILAVEKIHFGARPLIREFGRLHADRSHHRIFFDIHRTRP